MKKNISLVLVLVFMVAILASCGSTAAMQPKSSRDVKPEPSRLENLEGDDLKSIFKDYDLTMVNVWATWCGYCVEEMPELGKLYTQLPENVNLIGICTDCKDDPDTASEILTSSKADFRVLIDNESTKEAFTGKIQSLPTTIFVDKDGNVVGDPIVGAPKGDVVKSYLNAINKTLDKINAKQ